MTVAPLEASILRRPRLESRLDDALARRLTLLVADAGFGKSTLLTAWAGQHDVAWHTFAQEERSLAAAAAAVAGALERKLSFQSGEDDPGRVGAVASELCRDVGERLDRDLVLVLDDVHELGARTAGAHSSRRSSGRRRRGFHLVLSSRTEPSFGTQRLRGQGQVVELTAADLAFDVEEVDALLVLTKRRPSWPRRSTS